MKVLVVTYLARGEQSNTKKLADQAFEVLKAKKVLFEHLDLTKDMPDLLSVEHVAAYIDRNYMGKKLTSAQAATMTKMDRMTAQLKTADVLILAFPMYNFSQPAAVKAWFDSIELKGETWDITPSGFVGLMKGKKALVLLSSGGVYDGPMASWEHAISMTQVNLTFMGYESQVIVAAGMNRYPEKVTEILADAKKNVKAVLEKMLA
jgi:FMN-dependent NADH-azoreductase